MSYESGKVTANISGSVTTSNPTIPSGATQVSAFNTATNASATIHTVTAGKTLYITAATLDAVFNGAGTDIIYLKADILGTGVQSLAGLKVYGWAGATDSKCIAISFNPPVQVPATKTVTVVSASASSYGCGSIVGYEV